MSEENKDAMDKKSDTAKQENNDPTPKSNAGEDNISFSDIIKKRIQKKRKSFLRMMTVFGVFFIISIVFALIRGIMDLHSHHFYQCEGTSIVTSSNSIDVNGMYHFNCLHANGYYLCSLPPLKHNQLNLKYYSVLVPSKKNPTEFFIAVKPPMQLVNQYNNLRDFCAMFGLGYSKDLSMCVDMRSIKTCALEH